MESTFVSADDGIRLHLLSNEHDGPALVFVHGWCSNANHFAPQLKHFSDSFHVVAIDRRGHGQSDQPIDGYNTDRHARDLLSVLDDEEIASAVFVGHAGGCPSVLEFAARHPERCRALVLLDTRISRFADLSGADRESPLAQMIDSISDDDTFVRIYQGFVSERNPKLRSTLVNDALRVPRWIAQQDLASIAVDTVALAASVRCPVLWLSVDEPDTEMLTKVFDDIRFQQCPESGHFVQLEAADLVNEAIGDFLSRLSDHLTRDRETPGPDIQR